MRHVENLDDLSEKQVGHHRGFFSKATGEAIASNLRKHQYIFETTLEDRSFIVKTYQHRALKHRLASLIGQSNADRYATLARLLRQSGVPVPKPVLILKTGRGFLPEHTLYAMERIEGSMLSNLLPQVEKDPRRMATLAAKVSSLILGLQRAGVVHRDLNTKNFLVSKQHEVTLIDFDYSSCHPRRSRGFARSHERDIQMFLSTCHGAPQFAAAVRSHISTL